MNNYTIEDGVLTQYSGDPNVVVPDGVTALGTRLFSGCMELMSITMPDSITTIGASAFYGCWSLKEMVIPSSVTSIGINALTVAQN